MSVIESITSEITPIIEGSGNYLEEVTISSDLPKILTVVVDSDSHLTLDQVTVITKEISNLLETLSELGETPFTLEVTTPGIDRPLTRARHWRKNLGRLVTITLNDGTATKGRIGVSTDSQVEIEGTHIQFSDIKLALVEIEFKSLNKSENK
jgi:ribosome maturation factor RimP